MSNETETQSEAGQILFSRTTCYSVQELIGEGGFGKVAKGLNLATNETVAIKILKNYRGLIQDTEQELSILEAISCLNPDDSHVVKFIETFIDRRQSCLVFEMLDGNLDDLVLDGDNWRALSLHEIQPIASQLLVALDALQGLDIIHTDIKPDNVMFARMPDQSLKVKLIDFGLACHGSQVWTGMEIQPMGYRAPEVELGLPITVAIDMWGAACVLAFLYLVDNLFSVDCRYYMMKRIVELLGQPEDDLLYNGKYTRYLFQEEGAACGSRWRLMTPGEYTIANNAEPEYYPSYYKLRSLDDLIHLRPAQEPAELEDRRAFVDLLKRMLHLDGNRRISPHRALEHPFITMSHLIPNLNSSAIVAFEDGQSTGPPDELPGNMCYDKDPAPWASNGEVPPPWFEENPPSSHNQPTPWVSDEPMNSNKNSAPCFTGGDRPECSGPSGGDLHPDTCEEEPQVLSSGAVELEPGASASPGRKPFLKRVCSFFRRAAATICCCCRPNMEEN